MDEKKLMDTLGWGFILWVFRYAFSAMSFNYAFSVLSLAYTQAADSIASAVFLLMASITFVVAYKRLGKGGMPMSYYLLVALVWAAMSVIFDYAFTASFANPAALLDVGNFLKIAGTYIPLLVIPLAVGLVWGRPENTKRSS